jgi:hypothetical protein
MLWPSDWITDKERRMNLDYQTLKARQRKLRDTLPENVNIRAHRALSWLKAANEAEQLDAKFIFLWIAFNAVYAQEISEREDFGDKGAFRQFLERLIALDQGDLIYDIAWANYSGKIRLFIDNPFVSSHFWDFRNGRLSETEWKRRFDGSKRAAQIALTTKDTGTFTGILFDRLYILRNQLIHGGATWQGKVNRAQVRDGARILEQLVPVIIHILMENPSEEWGAPCFPPVE